MVWKVQFPMGNIWGTREQYNSKTELIGCQTQISVVLEQIPCPRDNLLLSALFQFGANITSNKSIFFHDKPVQPFLIYFNGNTNNN